MEITEGKGTTCAPKGKSDKAIIIIGTLDTKGPEVDYLRAEIERRGHETMVVDPGVLGEPQARADILRQEVALAGGRELAALVKEAESGADRATVTEVMMRGLARVVKELYSSGKVEGIISVGGSTGTALGGAAMRLLPLGVPKIVLSTHIYPQYVGDSDITIIQTPADIMGLNTVLRRTLSQAAGAIAGMVEARLPSQAKKPLIAITALGVTTPAVLHIQPLLHDRGYEMISFHAKSEVLDELVDQGIINGVMDLTSFEIIAIFVYPGRPERTRRLDSTLRKGIPLVVCPGGLDMIILRTSIDGIPQEFKCRKLHRHGPQITLIRTNKEEMVQAARVIAEKINRAQGPVAVVIPSQGFSEVDREGSSFYDPETDAAFVEELKGQIRKDILLKEIGCHINDRQFAEEFMKVFEGIAGKG